MSEILSFQNPSSGRVAAFMAKEHERSPVTEAALEWLETQGHVVAYWRDLLISEGGDDQVIAVLDRHADFLRWARLRRD
ncbi:hypothetical protein [Woodsholea maritima]|uniref:hypothetical protein n=1 Tax=Woodsholea maritima TaxID=240237 RepID=UPI00037FB595|nr:hypothetical protein [Woodsholea maritima]